MKKLFTLLLIITAFSARGDYWTQKASFPGIGREHPFSFAIGNRGYVGCGFDSFDNPLLDFWEYNQATNIWTQRANFAGNSSIIGFSINTKGYAGTGYYNANDFWEYDPPTDNWIQKANFGGAVRYLGSGFSIGDKGYIGWGSNTNLFFNDVWEWDQATNVWTQKATFPGSARHLAIGFSINTKGYFGLGYDTVFHNDYWEYDPVSNTWMQKADFPAAPRVDVAAFSICDKGYLGTGGEFPYYNDFWQYDPVLNQWIQKTNFPGLPRDDAAYFSIGNKGYIGLGEYNNNTNYLDFWEYTPDSACATGIEELPSSNLEFTISPNPAKDFLIIKYDGKEKINLTLTDVNGKVLTQSKILNPKSQIKIDISQFSKGIYFIEASHGKQKAVKKFLKE
jgi:N-acetylneuraminic acid mutarotase